MPPAAPPRDTGSRQAARANCWLRSRSSRACNDGARTAATTNERSGTRQSETVSNATAVVAWQRVSIESSPITSPGRWKSGARSRLIASTARVDRCGSGSWPGSSAMALARKSRSVKLLSDLGSGNSPNASAADSHFPRPKGRSSAPH